MDLRLNLLKVDKICIQLLYFLLITGLSHFVVEGRGLMYLSSGKGIFDNWAEWEHRGRTSRSELLLAFFIIRAHNGSWGPRHRLPGVRERKNAPECVHFFCILGRNVRQSYFPIISGVWIMLRLVLVRESHRGLWRPVSGCRGLVLLWGRWDISGPDLMSTLISMFFRFCRWNPRLIGFRIVLIRGRPRFNLMPTVRVRVFFRFIRDLLRRFLGWIRILIHALWGSDPRHGGSAGHPYPRSER